MGNKGGKQSKNTSQKQKTSSSKADNNTNIIEQFFEYIIEHVIDSYIDNLEKKYVD